MDEYSLNIFTMYYKRIMRVENELKTLIISHYSNLYNKNNVYKITYAQFFSKTENNKHSKDKTYTKLFNSNKTENEKFTQAVSKMYLSEITNFLGHPVFFKSKIRKILFAQEINTKTTEFQSNSRLLNEFRNCIAHIDAKKFNKDFKRFSVALEYFERLLGFNNVISISALKQINPSHRLSCTEILKIIYNTNKKLFEDDKILISVFDEIAMLNGYTYEALPQRWTIVRQKYQIEKGEKNNYFKENDDINQIQLMLDI